MIKKNNASVFESPDITAFISFYCGTNPRPVLDDKTHRVAFVFDIDVGDAVAAFYKNVPVPIADFCQKLKLIRSMIFSVKGGRGHEQK
jgi:hypothetical protein